MTGSVIVAARRSAVVPRGGAFAHLSIAHLSIEELSTPVLQTALRDANLRPEDVDEVIVSNALGAGGNPARIISLHADLPERVAGLTIDRQCAGGLDAITVADALIRSGNHKVVVAGGVESYSRRPLRLRTFADGRAPEPYDQARFTPWPDRDPDMACAANNLAVQHGISRDAQDNWAMESHEKARREEGVASSLVPINGVTKDDFTRNLTAQHCKRAPIVAGNVTVANMAVAADGAAFVVMMAPELACGRGFQGVRFLSGISHGAQPDLPGQAPVRAINSLLKRHCMSTDQICYAEIMEAFAVQAIVCQRGAGLPKNIVNIHGGALARGHPVGASGAILAVTLFDQLKNQCGYGLAAIAAAGGIGSAALFVGNQLKHNN